MTAAEGTEPVTDDEILYRRIPVSMGWYSTELGVSPEAFAPRRDEQTGISVTRAKYATVDEAARGRPGKSYYVAHLRVGELRVVGIFAEPRPNLPTGYEPAHAELPDLNSDNRKEKITLERQRMLVELCFKVDGPFDTPAD